MLSSGNGIGLELFSFIDPPTDNPPQSSQFDRSDWTRSGVWHFCITTPNIEEVREKILARGGKQIGYTLHHIPGEKAMHMKDPWNNIVELITCSMDHAFLAIANAAASGGTPL
jgi:hypothetical protein